MNEAEWTRAVTAAGPILLHIARQIVRDESAAEDVVAETYLLAWQKRGQLRERRRLLPWLKRICRNCALDLKRRRERDPLSSHAELIEGANDAAPTVERTSRHRQLLEQLPDGLKSIARMRFVDGMGYSEIAEIESLSTSTVRGRIHMAKEALREEIVMSAENSGPHVDEWDDGELMPAPDYVVVWRGMKLRLLGTWRPGERGFYSPAGRRLSRMPSAIRKSSMFQRWETDGWVDPARHVLVWFRRTGAPGYTFVQRCPTRSDSPDSSPVVCSRLSDAEGDDARRRIVSTLIGPVVNDDAAAVRFELELVNPCSVSAVPGWGAAFVSRPRTEKDKACTLTVAYSSPVAKTDWAVRGLTQDDREIDPTTMAQADAQCGEGGLTGLELGFPVAADELKGVVFRPRWHARVDWGVISVAPQSAPPG